MTEPKKSKAKKKKTKASEPATTEKFVKDFVLSKMGAVENLYEIKTSNIYDDRWRTDVWVKEQIKTEVGNLTDKYYIKYGYFMRFTDGKLTYCNPELKKVG